MTDLMVELEDELAAELDETIKREERTKKAVVARALREYIARSKSQLEPSTKESITRRRQAQAA